MGKLTDALPTSQTASLEESGLVRWYLGLLGCIAMTCTLHSKVFASAMNIISHLSVEISGSKPKVS